MKDERKPLIEIWSFEDMVKTRRDMTNDQLSRGGVEEDHRYELLNVELHDYTGRGPLDDASKIVDLGPCEIVLCARGDKIWGYLHLHNR